jgi:pimeloyl-ACP methyl ester carboxylesterase
LKKITQPVLVTNRNRDIMIPTVNSFTLSTHLPNAQLIIYPDSGHGALFQHAGAFVSHVSEFPRSQGITCQSGGMKGSLTRPE